MRISGIWVLPLAAVLGLFGLSRYKASASLCEACRRDVHHNSRTVATIEGRRHVFCCPACALAKGRQRKQPVRLLEISDFESGRPISPESAFLVRGSDAKTCQGGHAPVNETRHSPALIYDRCSPSLPAFGTHQSAERFAALHGGQVMRFREAEVYSANSGAW